MMLLLALSDAKPLILITGASGNLGRSLARAMADDFTVVGLDQTAKNDGEQVVVAIDVTSRRSVGEALDRVGREHGRDIAAVIHLVAFFDFSGEPDPRYDAVNVEGTRNLLAALEGFAVERFIYASTMLVHAPTDPVMLHREDMIDAVRRTVDRRDMLPPDAEILIAEPDPLG